MKTLKVSGFKKHLPNIITCFRIVFTFALPFLLWENWEREVTLPFFERTFFNVPFIWIIAYIILMFSDKLDGSLARLHKTESELGAVLDTVADALLIVMGAILCFIVFVRDSLETWQFWVYVGIVAFCVLIKVFFVFILTKIYHGKGNMIHSYFSKLFAISCHLSIISWAFLRTIPEWSIYSLLIINIYGVIDETVYIVRTAEYNVDFKGHGFEKYKKREKTNGKLR